ncbi:class I SAM-dependent methyltransferase [Pseudocolwellia sp. HL-MZ19]|uniref:class I SAM-dependent methyltransferase n=1 Tax=unclassified Pseudocolwellia TaxID=2848178 RepID=UPI003CF4B2EA
MYINPTWRILTIGDGDLSFSCSLLKHYQPATLTATIFDDYASLTDKYSAEHYQQLQAKNCDVLTRFDVTKSETWGELNKHQFDVVIFQFPLLPAFNSVEDFNQQCGDNLKTVSLNTLHRRLLRKYLLNCFNEFLDSEGAQLAFITSKDVKPYRQWNIEAALTLHTDINYLGNMPFEIEKFPGYKIRNVDRDKHVKDTQGISYAFSRKNTTELASMLVKPKYLSENYCTACRVGPFHTEQDRVNHLASKRHQQMDRFEQQWLADIK